MGTMECLYLGIVRTIWVARVGGWYEHYALSVGRHYAGGLYGHYCLLMIWPCPLYGHHGLPCRRMVWTLWFVHRGMVWTFFDRVGEGMDTMVPCRGMVWALSCHCWAMEWILWFVRVWGRCVCGHCLVSMLGDGMENMVCPCMGTIWTVSCVHVGRWNILYGLSVCRDGMDTNLCPCWAMEWILWFGRGWDRPLWCAQAGDRIDTIVSMSGNFTDTMVFFSMSEDGMDTMTCPCCEMEFDTFLCPCWGMEWVLECVYVGGCDVSW
jgi:hypothetical protein